MRARFAGAFASLLTAAVIFAAPFAASAAQIAWDTATVCGANCNWTVDIDNQQVLVGTYQINPDGSLQLTPGQDLTHTDADGSSVSINSLFGNVDPILGFSVGAGTGAAGKTFVFNFSLPIALSGLINANSSVSYSLTSLSSLGAQITPLAGHVVVAQEVDTTVGGLPPLNKGVDVGNTFAVLGGPATANSPVYTAANMFAGNAAYDLMSVTISFALSANSNVGISGFVQQEPVAVPLPAALPLVFSGLAWLGVVARRKKRG